AEQRAAVTDDASRIIQDRRQSANDLADVAAELALGVPELGCLQLADRTRAVVARGRFRNEARAGSGRKAKPVTDMLEALARAVAGLQGNDGAAHCLGDLPGAGAREVGEMAA